MTTELPPASDQPAPPAKSSGALVPLILFLIALFAAGTTALYIITIKNPKERSEHDTALRTMYMTGLSRPVVNKLSDKFTDADGDMIADAPTDPSKLVDPDKLVFCYVAVEDAEDYEKKWKAFTDHLSKVTGKQVEYLKVTNTDDQLKALRDGKLHVTGLNAGAIPLAVNICGFVPVARIPTNDPAGIHVEIIVPAGSSIQAPDEFKNQKFTLTLTEPNSNSGFKAPLVLLHEKGIDPERDYLFRTSGGHTESIDAVAKQTCEAAAVASDMLARGEHNKSISKGDYRSIFKSQSFPSAALGYAYNLKPELAAKVRQAIETFDLKGTILEEDFAPVEKTTLIPVNYKTDWSEIRHIDDACGQIHELK